MRLRNRIGHQNPCMSLIVGPLAHWGARGVGPVGVSESGLFQALSRAAWTVSATFSAVKPKCLNKTGAGADSP